MKYLKRYNEDINWEFEDEEIDKIYDGTFYLFLFKYNDEYSSKINDIDYRIFLGLDKDSIILDINDKYEIIFTNIVSNYNKVYNPNIIEGIKRVDSYITSMYDASSTKFRKWKFSELDSLLNIDKNYLSIFNIL